MASEPSRNDWERTKQRLMTRWPALTADELERTHGSAEAISGLLQARLGYAPANAQRDLDEILQGRTIVPRDVADEQTHTGSSGPVPSSNPASGLTSFPARAEERSAPGTAGSREPVEATSGPAGATGGGPVRDYPLDREPGAPPRPHTDDSQHGPTLGHVPPISGAEDVGTRDRPQHGGEQPGGMTSMLPMRGIGTALAIIAITAVMIVLRRRAARRRRGLIGRLERQMPATMIAKGARRWAQAAPREVMHAAERLREAA